MCYLCEWAFVSGYLSVYSGVYLCVYFKYVSMILFLGSGPDRGRSPVEWGDFPYVRSSVCTSPPLGHPARPEAQPARPEAQPARPEAQPTIPEA